jgi:hypothetical protein
MFWDSVPCSLADIYQSLEQPVATIYREGEREGGGATGSSEILVNTYHTAQRHIPEYSKRHSKRHENRKFHIVVSGVICFMQTVS